MPLDPLASPRHIAAELRRMADALDPEGARPVVVNHYHAPAIGTLSAEATERLARLAALALAFPAPPDLSRRPAPPRSAPSPHPQPTTQPAPKEPP